MSRYVQSLLFDTTITRIERLAIESVIQNHQFTDYHVYTYARTALASQSLPMLPVPAKYCDANVILPQTEFTPDLNGCYAAAKLEFQFRALFTFGGLWVDNDYVLLNKLPAYSFYTYLNNSLHFGVMQLEKESEFAARAVQYIRQARNIAQKYNKPVNITKILSQLEGIMPTQYKHIPYADLCSLDPDEAFELLTDPLHLENSLTYLANYGVKLYADDWLRAGCTFNTSFSKDALFEVLWTRFYGSTKEKTRLGKSASSSRRAVRTVDPAVRRSRALDKKSRLQAART